MAFFIDVIFFPRLAGSDLLPMKKRENRERILISYLLPTMKSAFSRTKIPWKKNIFRKFQQNMEQSHGKLIKFYRKNKKGIIPWHFLMRANLSWKVVVFPNKKKHFSIYFITIPLKCAVLFPFVPQLIQIVNFKEFCIVMR